MIWLFTLPLAFGLVVAQLGRLGPADSSGGVLFFDLALGWYVVSGLVWAAITKKRLSWSLSSLFLTSFTLWAGASLVASRLELSTGDTIAAFLYWIRLALFCLAFIITPTLFATSRQFNRLLKLVIGSGIVLVILGYVQLYIFPDFAFMAKFGWDPHAGRLLSTFFDPNYFGMFLAALLALIVALAPKKFAVLWWGMAGLVFVAILLTFSRSAYLATVIVITIIFAIRSWKLLLAATIAGVLIIATVPRVQERITGAVEIDTTAQDRFESWNESLAIFAQNPIFGVGWNAYGPALVDSGFKSDLKGRSARGGDSSLLLVAATTGFVGFIFYIGFLFSLLVEALVVYKRARSPFWRSLALALLGIIPAYAAGSQFVNGLFYPLLVVPFLLVASGLVVAMHTLGESVE